MNTNDNICCQEFSPDSAMRSPFGKIISLGFYDGTTSGVAQCSHCFKAYRYELVAWDSGQDTRIYSLANLPQEAFDAMVGLLSGIKGPTWPFWEPNLPSDSTEGRAMNAAIDTQLAKAESPARVIASRQLDKEILASREITLAARVKLPVARNYSNMKDWEFWRTYLAVDSLPESTR
jgi:hypothetical protein